MISSSGMDGIEYIKESSSESGGDEIYTSQDFVSVSTYLDSPFESSPVISIQPLNFLLFLSSSHS